jgi:hypothetical protein
LYASPTAHHFVEGEALQALVRAMATEVKLIRLTGESGTVTPAEALVLTRSGNWVGKVSEQGRLRYLRQFDQRTFPVDPAHWDGRAVVRFAARPARDPGSGQASRGSGALGPAAVDNYGDCARHRRPDEIPCRQSHCRGSAAGAKSRKILGSSGKTANSDGTKFSSQPRMVA